MQTAILTKYLGPTNHRGARIKATAAMGQSVTIPRSYGPGPIEDDHLAAARALCDKMGWEIGETQDLLGGATTDGYAWVFVDL